MSDASQPALYGHPFSSYTWKAQIALDAGDIAHEFRSVDDPEHAAFVANEGGPLGLFPVLVNGEDVVFEATSIIEYVDNRLAPTAPLLPNEAEAARTMRMLDRVFDNYVMTPATAVVLEHLRDAENPDAARCADARERLRRSYAWLERWLPGYRRDPSTVTLIECAAAPSLFYADWVEPIGDDCPRLRSWRTQLLSLPPVASCVERARPYRAYFPPGAPDRD